MITSKNIERTARLKHAGAETANFWWLNIVKNVIPQSFFCFLCAVSKPHEHAMLRLKKGLNMTR